MGIFNLFSKSPEDKLLSYLKERIENAGKQNNLMKNDPLLSPMGFIGAMGDEKEYLKTQTSKLSRQFNVSEAQIHLFIDDAYQEIYNKYIE